MPQYLKDHVQERIAEAALSVFAGKGFAQATMAEIAREAGVSTGNVYRYFESKEVLFDAVVPRSMVDSLVGLLRRRVRSLRGVREVEALGPQAPFRAAAEELLAFSVAHRRQVIVALGRATGTPHEGVAGEVIDLLIELALTHFRALDPGLRLAEPQRLALRLVYENLVRSMVSTLERFEAEADIRAAVGAYERYHLAGLRGLLG